MRGQPRLPKTLSHHSVGDILIASAQTFVIFRFIYQYVGHSQLYLGHIVLRSLKVHKTKTAVQARPAVV